MAARMAAQSMCGIVGCPLGGTVGYQVRLDRRIGPDTRIEVLTEGLLARRLLDDPGLGDAGLVIFDEFHERSLHADFGLALLLESKAVLRPDMRIVMMSATLDTATAVRQLGDGAVAIRADARAWPVETIHIAVHGGPRAIPDAVAACVARALGETDGGILAFLPGEGEIRRTSSLLADMRLPAGVDVMPLYGSLGRQAQDAAVGPVPSGRRKVVLSTSIAESSLTVEGIAVVIDCGWSRVSRFSNATGMSKLETIRVTRDRADQRRGRAGRLGPGVCYRLWDAMTDSALQDESVPEIVNADLAPVRLDAAVWGVRQPGDLRWPTPPPEHSWRMAGNLLRSLEALDDSGAVTERGREMARIAAHPRLAHMIVKARDFGKSPAAALLAAIVEEAQSAPFLRGEDDLRWIAAFVTGGANAPEDSPDGAAARDWAARTRKIASQWAHGKVAGDFADISEMAGRMLSWAFPDRIAQSRDGGSLYRLSGGHGARLGEGSRLLGERTIVAAELQDDAADAAIRLAAPVDMRDVQQDFAHLVETSTIVRWNAQTDRIVAARRRRIGAIVVAESPLENPPEELLFKAVEEGIRAHGVANLGWNRNSRSLQARLQFLHRVLDEDGWPDVSDGALAISPASWLGNWLSGVSSWNDLKRIDLCDPLMSLAGYRRQELDRLAPEHLTLPCGRRARIDYCQDERPVVSAKLQDFFGLTATPTLAGGRVKAKICLLSPAQRPVAVTDDLTSFWREGYILVRKDMRGRYPKHDWPEIPPT